MPTKDLLKSAAVGAFLFVLPVVILVLFAGHAAQLLADHVLRPLADRFQIGPAEATGLAIVALGVVLLAWVALQRLNRWFWENLSNRGQDVEVRAGARHEPGGPRRASQLVLVQNEGRFALGFHVDTLENGLMVVQTPGARLARDRGILYLPPDQVSLLAPASVPAHVIDPVPREEPVRFLRRSPPLADHRLQRG